MLEPILTAASGFAAGLFAGAFGVGGGMITTPAARLLLGYPGLVAVGTSLFVVVLTAAVALWAHLRMGQVDLSVVPTIVGWGMLAAIAGAGLATALGHSVVLLAVAGLLVVTSASFLRKPADPQVAQEPAEGLERDVWPLRLTGVCAGLLSGLLGIGGGIVIVPILARHFGYPMKKAIGTSLAVVIGLALPGAIAHQLLGNVDVSLAVGLAAGSVPGALLGAWLTSIAADKTVRTGFGVFLALTGVWLATNELAALL